MMIWGDCLPLPCGTERIPYELTYAGLLQKALPSWQILNRAVAKLVVSRQLRMIQNDLRFWNPDVAIIHLGAADLYPHLADQKNLLPAGTTIIHKVMREMRDLYPRTLEQVWVYCMAFLARSRVHRRAILKIPIIQSTPITVFQEHFDHILKVLEKACKLLIVLGIAIPGRSLRDRVPEIGPIVSAFNKVLEDSCAHHNALFIDCREFGNTRKLLQEDSIHLSTFGHKMIFDKIIHNCIERQCMLPV